MGRSMEGNVHYIALLPETLLSSACRLAIVITSGETFGFDTIVAKKKEVT